jgi:GTP cyclohydrolase II
MNGDEPASTIVRETLDVPLRVFGRDVRVSVFEFSESSDVVCIHIGNLTRPQPVPVRLHSSCVLGEVLDAGRCDCGWQLRAAVAYVADAGVGVVVYLREHDGRGNGLSTLVASVPLVDAGGSSAEAFESLGVPTDARVYTAGCSALRQLGVRRITPLTNNALKIKALQDAGFELEEPVPLVMPTEDPRLLAYLRAKSAQPGHLIEEAPCE